MEAYQVLVDQLRRSAKEYDGVQSHVAGCNVLLGCDYAQGVGNPVRCELRRGWVSVTCCGTELLAARYADADGVRGLWETLASVEPFLMALASAGWLQRGSRGPKVPRGGVSAASGGEAPPQCRRRRHVSG